MQIQGGVHVDPHHSGVGQGDLQALQKGSFQGQEATVRTTNSRLTDIAEEMTLHFSEKVEQKDAAERDIRPETRLQVMRVEEIIQYLTAAKADQTPGDLAALAKRMLAAQQSPGQIARQTTEDPTQQSLMLQFALHEGERTGAPADALGAIRDALAELELESGPAILAGLNSIDAASQFGGTTQSIRAFQNTYRNLALGSSSLVETLKLALDRFGGLDFARGLKSLLQALGSDLAALRPSTQPAHLQAVVQDIYQLEVFNTLLERSEKIGAFLIGSNGTKEFDSVDLMKQLVSMTGDRWATANRFEELPPRFGIQLLQAEIYLIAQSLQLLRDMPFKIYADADSRRLLLSAGQEALDKVIEREEDSEDDDTEGSADNGENNSGPTSSQRESS